VVTNSQGICFGYYNVSGNNCLTLTNGAVFHAPGKCHLGHSNGTGPASIYTVTSGSTLQLGDGSHSAEFGRDGSSKPAQIVAYGEGSRVILGKASAVGSANMLQGGANGCSVLIKDGAYGRLGSGEIYLGGVSYRDCSITFDKAADSSTASIYFSGKTNTLNVIDSNVGSGLILHHAGDYNGIFVSNGVSCCESYSAQDTSTNNYVCLAGTHPLFYGKPSANTSLSFGNGTRLIFNIPFAGYDFTGVAGYETVTAPLHAENHLSASGTTSLKIENLDELKSAITAAGVGRKTYKLIEVKQDYAPGIANMVNAANASQVAQGVRYTYKSETGYPHNVYVTVRVKEGMLFLVR